MTLTEKNVPLVTFEPRDVDGFELSTTEVKELVREASTRAIPVFFQRGAIQYKIGAIRMIRIGRDEAFADIWLSLKGELIFEPILDDEENVIGAKPSKYVYTI